MYLCKKGYLRIICSFSPSHLNGKKTTASLISSHLCEFGVSAVGELTAQIDRPIWIRSDLIFHSNPLTPDHCKRGKSETLELSNVVAYIKIMKMKARHQANMKHTKVTVIFVGLSFLREKVESQTD